MKKYCQIKDKKAIFAILENAKYGTLALCDSSKPYSVPINFVCDESEIYFHGALNGKKIQIIKKNPFASFSVVEAYSYIPSYFTAQYACTATHFFKSVIVDGMISFIDNDNEKRLVMEKMMKKFQPEEGYADFSDDNYNKMLKTTHFYKLKITSLNAKAKFAQHKSKEVVEKIIQDLEKRGEKLDLQSAEIMKSMLNTKLD